MAEERDPTREKAQRELVREQSLRDLDQAVSDREQKAQDRRRHEHEGREKELNEARRPGRGSG
jgi:hypothetical protein